MTLDLVPEYCDVSIINLSGGHRFLAKMTALGFCRGASVRVIRNSSGKPMLVFVSNTRVVLGRGAAQKVCVQMIDSK